MNKIIHLTKIVDVPLLEAALLEKNTQLQINSKLLKKMNSAKVPKSIIDLLIAMANPDKFQIAKNGRIVVASNSRSEDNAYPYPYPRNPLWEYNGGFYGVRPYPGFYPWDDAWNYPYSGPWNGYWNYSSPFWSDYPIYINVPYNGNSGGSGGGGGGGTSGPPNPNSAGRLSSGSGYIQVTPRDTGHRAVPRNSYAPSSGSPASYTGYSQVTPSSSGASTTTYTHSSGDGGSAAPSSGGGSTAPSASPSGYSSGSSGGGQAVPRK